ncbi:hypothetical protein, partial [Agrobacterium tumefaciens]|uniref:hypothetical protein n=1 Tax=Agrobacterium tumefaciens TaxID=358 RepID=UPI003BA0A4A1
MARSNWPEWLGVCFVAMCTALAVAGWPNWADNASVVWASWIQSVGSVFAVVVAIGVVVYQNQVRRSNIASDRVDQLKGAAILTKSCSRLVGK